MDEGYIKLYRSLLDNRIWQNKNLTRIWTWCLLKANYKPNWVSVKTGIGTTEVFVKRGQFIFGRKKASKALRMKESTIRNCMEKLKNLQKLDIQANTHFSIVTIYNYDKYQGSNTEKGQTVGQPKDNQRTTKRQPRDTNNNDKNDNNEKDIYASERYFEEFIEKLPERMLIGNKKRAYILWKKSVRTKEDWNNIYRALREYLEHLEENSWKKIQLLITWLNQWEEWIPEIKTEKPFKNKTLEKMDQWANEEDNRKD